MPKSSAATALLLFLTLVYGIVTAQSIPVASAPPLCLEPEFKGPEHMLLPKYPMDTLGSRTDTTIELHAVVGADGNTREITGPSEPREFADESLEAVRTWSFHPAVVDGSPVETVYKIHIHFNSVLGEVVPQVQMMSPEARVPSPAEPEGDASDETVYKAGDPGVVAPRATYQIVPDFPEKATKRREVGDVILSAIVGTDGRVHSPHVECGAAPDLNQQALKTIALWRFEPGTKDGEPVPVRIEISTSFHTY